MQRSKGLFVVLALGAAPAAAQTVTLPDIVVSANRTPTAASATGSAVTVLPGSAIEADGHAFALHILGTVPGVTVNQSGPAGTVTGFSVRGAPQQYTRVLIDGIEVSDPTGPQVAGSLSGLLLDDVGRIEVLRGSQSALYGGQAVAGVIDISTPRPDAEGIETRYLAEGGSFDSYRGSVTVAGRAERSDFALTLVRLQTDGFSAAEEADGNPEDDGYETTRVSASGTYYASELLSVFGSAFGQWQSGDSDAFGGPGGDAPDTYDTDTWGARAGFDLTSADGRLENRVSVSRYDIDRKTYETYGDSRYQGERLRAEYLGAWYWSDAVTLQFGGDWTREDTDTATPFGGLSADTSIAGLFAQAIWAPVDPLTVTFALRNDNHSEFGNYPTGRITAAWDLTTDTTLRGSFGTGFRAPSNYELFDPTYGNPGLEPETSVSADIGAEHRFAGGRGNVAATLFLLDIKDLIGFTTRYEQVSGTARSRGLELAAAWGLTDSLTLSGAYTYTDADDANGAQRLRVPRHDLSVTLDGDVAARTNLALSVRYAADLPDEPFVTSSAFESSYTVVDARIGYALTDHAELYLRAENIFDAQYQTVEGYSTADRSFFAGIRGTF